MLLRLPDPSSSLVTTPSCGISISFGAVIWFPAWVAVSSRFPINAGGVHATFIFAIVFLPGGELFAKYFKCLLCLLSYVLCIISGSVLVGQWRGLHLKGFGGKRAEKAKSGELLYQIRHGLLISDSSFSFPLKSFCEEFVWRKG